MSARHWWPLLAALSVLGCDSVSGLQINTCAKGCEMSGQMMESCTDKECKCRAPMVDGGAK